MRKARRPPLSLLDLHDFIRHGFTKAEIARAYHHAEPTIDRWVDQFFSRLYDHLTETREKTTLASKCQFLQERHFQAPQIARILERDRLHRS